MIRILTGDCRDLLATLGAESVHAVVTDPPYHLLQASRKGSPRTPGSVETPYGRTRTGGEKGFMGQTWDGGDVAFQPDTWRAVLRVMKPGAHLVAFGGTRTYHRMVCAIEDAGFEIRDQIGWLYGSGFPKSLGVGKAIDKAAGAERKVTRAGFKQIGGYGDDWDTNSSAKRERRDEPATTEAEQWDGWGTALKPAWEPIVVARKPLIGTVAENVLAHGTGALNINGCRVETTGFDLRDVGRKINRNTRADDGWGMNKTTAETAVTVVRPDGRWPANIAHDGSDEVLSAFAAFGTKTSGKPGVMRKGTNDSATYGAESRPPGTLMTGFGDSGTAARFFYCAKASGAEREGNTHPTVKPLALMRWLCRLVTPPGGLILDPFAGSGSTGLAAQAEGFDATLVELEPKHVRIIRKRLGLEPALADRLADLGDAVERLTDALSR